MANVFQASSFHPLMSPDGPIRLFMKQYLAPTSSHSYRLSVCKENRFLSLEPGA
jgi:hypothetical protein